MKKSNKSNEKVKEILLEEDNIVVNELVQIKSSIEISMKRIVNLTEEFSQTMEPILCMYNAAMSVAVSRLEIIQNELAFGNKRCPIHHIDSRLKSAKSILGKLERKDMPLTLNAACSNIYDIAGVRVVCPYRKDVYLIQDRILAQDDIVIMKTKDYIKNPKCNGYRSLHMTIRVPVYFMNKKQMVPVELQIRTLAMDLWASLEHDIKYKSINKNYEIDVSDELLECSNLIYQAEEKMEIMNFNLES